MSVNNRKIRKSKLSRLTRWIENLQSKHRSRTRRMFAPRLQSLEQRELLAADFTIQFSTSALREDGGSTTATVSFINIPTESGTYSISTTDPDRLQTPSDVFVANGQGSVDFEITGIDNSIIDTGTLREIQVTSPDGSQVATASLLVVDDEGIPGFSVSVSPNVISESQSTAPATATITLDQPVTERTAFFAISGNQDRLDTPKDSIFVEAGSQSATFDVYPYDNAFVDGDAVVDIFVTEELLLNTAVTSVTILDDDIAPEYSVAFEPSTISENGGSTTGTITLNQPVDFWVDFRLSFGDDRLYSPDFNISIPPGNLTDTFQVISQDDFYDNGDRVVDVTVRDLIADGAVTESVTIIDDDQATVEVQFWSENTFEGVSDGGQLILSHPFEQDTQVLLTSSDTSEVVVPQSVTVSAGDTFRNFSFDVVADNLVDGDKTVTVSAELPSGATGSDSILVYDGDSTRLSLQLDGSDVAEGGPALGAELRLTTPMESDLDVQISADVVDQISFPSNITIPAGASRVPFEITAIDDLLDEDDYQQIILTISNSGGVTIQNPDEYLFVQDNDLPRRVELFLPTNQLTEGETITASLLLRNGPLPTDTAVDFTLSPSGVAPDIDFPASLTIPAGQTQVDFPVTAIDDTIFEANTEFIDIQLSSNVAISNDFYFFDVADNDSIDLNLTLASDQFDETAGVVDLIVSLNGTLEYDAPISFGPVDPTEALIPSTFIVPAGSETVVVPVTIVDDGTVDGNQRVFVDASFSELYANDFEFVEFTVRDTTESTLTVELADTAIDENGGTTTANLSISAPFDIDQTYYFGTESGPSLDFGSGSVTIPAGQTSGQVTITAIDNDLVEGDQVSTIGVFNFDQGDLFVDLTILEDDVLNSPPSVVSVAGANSLAPTPLGQATVLTGVVADANAEDTLSVTVDWGDGTVTQANTIAGEFDTSFDALHTYAETGIYQVSVTVSDGIESASQTTDVFVSGAIHREDGSLLLIGTGGDDRFDLLRRNSGANVEVRWDFTGNEYGQRVTLPASSIANAEIYLGDGNNRIKTSSKLAFAMNVHAGYGTDQIDTGKGNDTVIKLGGDSNIRTRSGSDTIITGGGTDIINAGGGADFVNSGGGDDQVTAGGGSDVVLGGSGSDLIRGGSGKDVIIGGTDADQLFGDGSNDLLIGGTTAFDDDRDALDSIAAVWSSGNSYSSRVDALIAGVGDDSTIRLVDGDTVLGESGVSDFLQGGNSSDWFFADDDDQIDDLAGSERTGS